MLAGKYRVERVIGRGGMGVVVEATQVDLERRVALKFLRPERVADSPVALARFEREARMVARLKGAHVVQVYDVGKLEHGEPFIVMELLHGEDLSTILDRERRLPLALAADYVIQTCEAMAEAHAAGVIHRDLKPANLFVARGADGRPVVKVLDFGISKLVSAEGSTPSLTGGVLGSPLYMSPEQLSSSKSIDARTDVWSLGAILYELVTGVAAFQGEGVPQICTRIMLEAPAPPSALVADLPLDFDQVVAWSLQKLPDDRYPSVADLALALLPFARKASHGNVETTVRIVRASSLPHGRLPDTNDSLPPLLGAPSPAWQDRAPPDTPTLESAPNTLDIGNAPGTLTQGELKPMMATIARAGTGSRARVLLLAAIALVAPLVSLLLVRGLRGTSGDAEKSAAALAPPAALPQAVASAEPRVEPSRLPSAAPSALPVVVAPPARSHSAATPRKPKPPLAAADPSPEELLKHR